METKVNLAAVGLFVVILVAALVAGILWLASGGAVRKHYDHYLAIEEESVAGLNVNAAVKYNGVDVGKVYDIRLDRADPTRVTLEFLIESGTPIKTNTEAVLKTQGLTGIAYVELSGSTADAPPLVAKPGERYPVIKTKPSLAARLENVMTTALAKLDVTSNNINALLSDDNLASVKSTLANLKSVTDTIAARRETLNAGIASAAQTFDNTARATADLGPLIERIGRSVDALEKMGNEAAQASVTAGRTLDSAGRTIDSVGGDIKRFTADALPETQRLLGELSVLATSLRRLSERIEGSPGGLLVGRRPVPPGPGEKPVEANE
jgi:phospholipid/cholesterol/gamma-HCH transport system substrate-binding protein